MLGDAELRKVALHLKRRHLRSHLEAWRSTRESLEAAWRSRQKRARLIRLARRHRLRFCLSKLREPGFTLSHGYHGIFLHYEPSCTREYLQGLESRLIELGQEWRQLRRQSLEPILANLRSLLEEAEVIRIDPYEVSWTLPDIYLEGIWIGNMDVILNLEVFQVQAYNRSADTEIRGGYQHPHVNSSGEICWNGHDEEAEAYHRAGDFLALKDLITNLLQTYNSSSPYINLEDWENGLGECCCDCGERYPEDELAYVETYDGNLCPECRSYCERCDQYVHYRDYECDPDHNWEMCKWCAEEYTNCCSNCDGRFLSEGLHRIEIPGEEEIQVVHLCEDCYEDYLRKEAEDNADLDDTTSILAPAMAVPSHSE